METLLAIDPQQSGTADLTLKSEFFTTEPHACDPSSLPQYPPSKEIDAKKRDDEAKRGVVVKEENKGPKERRAVPAGLIIEQPTLSKASKDNVKRSPPIRGSYSGPLVAAAGPRRNTTAQPTNYQPGKLSESTQEFMRHRNNLPQNMAGPCRIGSGRATNMVGEGYTGIKIQFSGPLISSNVDQMLKDHDLRIQEAARRSRLAK